MINVFGRGPQAISLMGRSRGRPRRRHRHRHQHRPQPGDGRPVHRRGRLARRKSSTSNLRSTFTLPYAPSAAKGPHVQTPGSMTMDWNALPTPSARKASGPSPTEQTGHRVPETRPIDRFVSAPDGLDCTMRNGVRRSIRAFRSSACPACRAMRTISSAGARALYRGARPPPRAGARLSRARPLRLGRRVDELRPASRTKTY